MHSIPRLPLLEPLHFGSVRAVLMRATSSNPTRFGKPRLASAV
jgi:hypothetical protein